MAQFLSSAWVQILSAAFVFVTLAGLIFGAQAQEPPPPPQMPGPVQNSQYFLLQLLAEANSRLADTNAAAASLKKSLDACNAAVKVMPPELKPSPKCDHYFNGICMGPDDKE